MAIANFDITQNLKVELYLPFTQGAFIIGVSNLGGTDVLTNGGFFVVGESLLDGTDLLGDSSTYAFSWQPIQATISKVDMQLGGSQNAGISYTAEPSSCNFEMQSWTFDPNNNSAVRNGTPFRIRLVATGVDEILFNGFIETMNVKYRPDAPNLINGSAFDGFKRFANKRVTYNTIGTPDTVAELLGILASNAGVTVSDSNSPGIVNMAGATKTNELTGNIVKEMLETQLGLLWLNPQSGAIEYRDRPTTALTPTYSVGNNHGEANHLCMSDLTVNQNPDDLVNSILATMTSDGTKTLLRENTDSIQLYGQLSDNVTVNVATEAELATWMNVAFIERPKQLVKNVTTPAIDRTGTLTAAATLQLGSPIKVKYQTSNINIDQNYQVTRLRHSIDPNQWFTTLELWRAS